VVVQTTIQEQFLARHYDRKASLIVKNFHPLPEQEAERGEKVRVVWVANFKAVKRPEIFVDLAERFAERSDCEFIMIGRRGAGPAYKALHGRIETTKNLTFMGEIAQESVNSEISRSHLLVNTSSMEGFPNTFVQAWMRGLPVVTMGVNTDKLFDQEDMGFCTENFADLFSRVDQLVTDRAMREKLGAQGKAYAMENHSLRNVDALISLLRAN